MVAGASTFDSQSKNWNFPMLGNFFTIARSSAKLFIIENENSRVPILELHRKKTLYYIEFDSNSLIGCFSKTVSNLFKICMLRNSKIIVKNLNFSAKAAILGALKLSRKTK